jgi:sulfide:quinone oxidoreductase
MASSIRGTGTDAASATMTEMTRAEGQSEPTRVIVAGGGIAGAEAMLALRALAGERVSLTLVSPSEELVLPALTVAEPFALGQAQRYGIRDLLTHVNGQLVPGSLASVDQHQREIRLEDGGAVAFDALVIATGARAVARIEHATTWWPTGDMEAFGGLLRDLEEGYNKRVAFVIPPGAVWPLPLYEIALMTAREVFSMGIDGAEVTVITPEAVPLALFGSAAAVAVREELDRAGIHLHTATVARVQPGHPVEVVLQPTAGRLAIDRVVALPGVEGPRIPGTTQNEDGFILVGPNGQMRDSDCVWAAGDAIAYPVKFGGLASQQADAVAAEIAARIGVGPPPARVPLRLRGVLMTGAEPRGIGAVSSGAAANQRPIWRPVDKVFGTHLTPYLKSLEAPVETDVSAGEGVVVDEALPGPDGDESETFHALWRAEQGSAEYLRRLGHNMDEYATGHAQAAEILRGHGQLAD